MNHRLSLLVNLVEVLNKLMNKLLPLRGKPLVASGDGTISYLTSRGFMRCTLLTLQRNRFVLAYTHHVNFHFRF